MIDYRPWGGVEWLLQRLGREPWWYLGCLGTEERSIALPCHFERSFFNGALMAEILDPDPIDHQALDDRLLQRKTQLLARGYLEEEIVRENLLASIEEIQKLISRVVERGATRLVIDITSFPKLWFFAIVKAALNEPQLVDVVVCYTSAMSYADKLSENVGPLRVLPGFYAVDGRSTHDSLIVGIGFEPTGLISVLSDQKAGRIRLIFPFPPGPPGHRRNWMFVKEIEDLTESQQIDPPDRVHIHMYDCPQIFDALCEMTDDSKQTSALAPYGPKTVSLAMCLFALATEKVGRQSVPVYYAQPLRYALDYSVGVRMNGNAPDTIGYCIRLNGRDLYTIPRLEE